ncbi:sulfite exporter TauE/SafE family protein [Bifidobacterium aerophilum]|uniref:Probable membrane transporter protein n=1 Tax=Bifidobacterium aerophilum TaxID=1798155 RepID=A0A6N9Z7S6_9BIFI|nr:sulfite exporter TauE/SafE family protein [Bifidobacterium aerophilum]NEG90551.1 TSUP family transporter [Bifidobacterium aerophilum]
MTSGPELLNRRGVAVLACVGLACGLLSGLFGIGGGTIIVPALVWLGLSQRHAAATSLAAIVPTSISGVVSYATEGNVNWIAAALLALGVIVGSQLGSLLLSRLPEVVLRWVWVAFLIFVIIQQITFTPPREGHLVLHVWSGAFLVLLGVVTGALAGVLGIGGGAIMMPALSFLFGASDLMARGTSLLVMVPGALSGTAANWKRGIVHLKSGLIIGCCAVLTAPLGTMAAGWLTPRAGSLLFAAWLAVLAVRSIWTALKVTRRA